MQKIGSGKYIWLQHEKRDEIHYFLLKQVILKTFIRILYSIAYQSFWFWFSQALIIIDI